MASKIFSNVFETSVQDTPWSALIFLQLHLCVWFGLWSWWLLIIGALVVDTEFTCVVAQFHGIKALLRHKFPITGCNRNLFYSLQWKKWCWFCVCIKVKEFNYTSDFSNLLFYISISHSLTTYLFTLRISHKGYLFTVSISDNRYLFTVPVSKTGIYFLSPFLITDTYLLYPFLTTYIYLLCPFFTTDV